MDKRDTFLSLPEAIARLTAGQVVIFPTDTVWGVGAKWQSQRGVETLYQVKQREDHKAMAILVAEVDQLAELGLDFNALTPDLHRAMLKLIKEFWPGGLTLVLPWPHKPNFYRWSEPTLGVRVPNHPITQELLRQAGPILQSSANISGGLPPASYAALDPEFIDQTGGVVTGESGGESASTVINLTGPELQIVRAGCIPLAEIEKIIAT